MNSKTAVPADAWHDRPGVHYEGPQHVIDDVAVTIDLPAAPPGMSWVRAPVPEKNS